MTCYRKNLMPAKVLQDSLSIWIPFKIEPLPAVQIRRITKNLRREIDEMLRPRNKPGVLQAALVMIFTQADKLDIPIWTLN